MKTPNIDQLLEKYWEGETSLQEEQDIKAYFAAGDVLPEHAEMAPLFGYFANVAQVHSEKDFSKELVNTPIAKTFNLSYAIRTMAAIFALGICAYTGYQLGQEAKVNNNNNMVYVLSSHFYCTIRSPAYENYLNCVPLTCQTFKVSII